MSVYDCFKLAVKFVNSDIKHTTTIEVKKFPKIVYLFSEKMNNYETLSKVEIN